MVSQQSVEEQLKRLNFNVLGWGRGEVRELQHVLLPDEEIYDLVNGIYEGGFALLVATDVRLLLVDKKPMNYLTVEDLRFDMINEIDYSHRLIGAQITVSSGDKTLRFRSYNQARLRKVIGHVQHCMAAAKKKQSTHAEDQKTHLEQINQQLQAYLIAQHQQQQQLHEQLQLAQAGKVTEPLAPPEPVKPSPELSDYLYAQGLLAEYRKQASQLEETPAAVEAPVVAPSVAAPQQPVVTRAASTPGNDTQLAELYNEGRKEIFGRREAESVDSTAPLATTHHSFEVPIAPIQAAVGSLRRVLDPNPLKIASAKLPMALRNRKFSRPSFRAPNQAETQSEQQPQVAGAR